MDKLRKAHEEQLKALQEEFKAKVIVFLLYWRMFNAFSEKLEL